MSDVPDELSKALRLLVKRGNLTHLSVISSDGVWKAAYRGVDDRDFRHVQGTDIVDVLMEAVTGRRSKARKIEKPAKVQPVAAAADEFEDLLG